MVSKSGGGSESGSALSGMLEMLERGGGSELTELIGGSLGSRSRDVNGSGVPVALASNISRQLPVQK